MSRTSKEIKPTVTGSPDNAGRVYTFGTQSYGSMQGKVLNKPVVAIAASAGF